MRNLSVFSRQFATLIQSGMPMLRSLYTLEEQTEDEMLKPAIASLRADVEAGSSLNQAMERQPGVFDPLYRSMVQAGEGSGRLEQSLDRVAIQLEKLDALRRQVKSAMMYPAVVFARGDDRDDRDRRLRRARVRRHLRGDRGRERRPSAGAAVDDQDHGRGLRRGHRASGTSCSRLLARLAYVFIRWKKTERGRDRVGPVQAADPDEDRRRGPEGRPGALVADLLRAPSPPACRSCRRSRSPARRPATP